MSRTQSPCKLRKRIKKCGLLISKDHPMIAGSPDGICDDSIIEIKCPISAKTYNNYLFNGKPTKKCYAQIQLQMYLSGLNKDYFCVAYWNYTETKNVDIVSVSYDDKYVSNLIKV